MSRKKRNKLIIQVLAVCIVSALILTIVMYGLRLDTVFGEGRKLPIYHVDTNDKKVAISFDCAWGNEHTKAILDILDQYDVKTTFFMVKFWAEKFPNDVLEIHKRGHEIGNHSSTHPNMTKLSVEDITKELKDTEDVIVGITNQRPTLFRPPFGAYNNKVIETCENNGYHVIQWNVDSLDWKDITAEQIVDRVTRNVVPGSIILFHNNAEHVEEYLPSILSRLQADGYEVVPIGQLIIKENYHIDHTGKQVAD
jgi:polysaccharide deacetylase family sporulation protein PdaB